MCILGGGHLCHCVWGQRASRVQVLSFHLWVLGFGLSLPGSGSGAFPLGAVHLASPRYHTLSCSGLSILISFLNSICLEGLETRLSGRVLVWCAQGSKFDPQDWKDQTQNSSICPVHGTSLSKFINGFIFSKAAVPLHPCQQCVSIVTVHTCANTYCWCLAC